MEFVVNEWLPEYFKPDAPLADKQKLEHFLNRFLENNDVIYVRRPSAFLEKVLRLSKVFGETNIKSKREISKFISIVLQDTNRCKYIDDEDFELDYKVKSKLSEKGNYVSDLYLFEAASVLDDKIIITTDEKLVIHIHDFELFKVILLDDFLKNY